ncbi:MAG: hypothetical protein R3E53_11300 [Myxococcota bacterium]
MAIDVSPLCTALCRERGVRDARTLDVMRLEADASLGRFDTILFGMQTIGVAGGTLALERLLGRLRHRLEPGGGILADSSALREPWEGDATDRSASRGEIVLSTRYRGWRRGALPWLYLAEEDLCEVAGRRASGWRRSREPRTASSWRSCSRGRRAEAWRRESGGGSSSCGDGDRRRSGRRSSGSPGSSTACSSDDSRSR